ncbi:MULTISPECIES: methionine biosynthesis PLP-dependent protein [Bacillaceae]|uniref:Methionine biosynthesis PLP-dependent protein n=1 Tax=Evansella alkalicola TaxID=745819 RepID=A0ABS6JWK4_9BACI|nr:MULTISPECIES: methionine biosynthesis PLP-dependent protein [Bacillaceae]MBU9722944.1 methionine biosynthesis PLP-dependent protein [Bacillus alkalicola]
MRDGKEIPCCTKETELVQIGNNQDLKTGAVNTPVYFSTAYRHTGIGESTGYDYSRTANPTRTVLEAAIAKLEHGDRGFATSSGMAAIHTVFGLFKQGDEIIVSKDIYGGTYRLFEQVLNQYGISFKYADIRKPEAFEALITENTKALFIESPTNPLMQEADIKVFGELAKKKEILLIVDNTFYTPLLQQPIKDGAHIVIHSATKYLGGHNDVLAGLIVTKGEELSDKVFTLHNGIGATLSPMDSWLLIRGMKTLALRLQKHEENAKLVVKYLEDHEAVQEVLYPGRGGMISFRVKKAEWVDSFLRSLQLITFAESLGGVESFITYPATQTHADIPEEVRFENGVCNKLLRFSVGIEGAEDLLKDLDQALQAARKEATTNE